MNLLEIRRAASVLERNHSILMYGPPKGGKTRLAATCAELDEVENVYLIDLENGAETIVNSGMSDAALQKIKLIRITDTRDDPVAIETILKSFTSKVPLNICELHGKVECAECKKSSSSFIKWSLNSCTHKDVVIVDSGSQLGDSALAAACLGKPGMFKPTFDEYGMVNKWLGDVCSVIQQCAHTNIVVITHEIALKDDEDKDKIFPLMGSKAFSMKCAKYYGTVVYVHKKLGKHVAGSSSTYRADLLTGSRLNVALEKSKEPHMRDILIQGGILGTPESAGTKPQAEPTAVAKPALSLAERLKQAKTSVTQ